MCELLSECFKIDENAFGRRAIAPRQALRALWKLRRRSTANSMAIFVCTAVGRIHFRVNACEKTVKAGLTSVGLTAMPLYKCLHTQSGFKIYPNYY